MTTYEYQAVVYFLLLIVIKADTYFLMYSTARCTLNTVTNCQATNETKPCFVVLMQFMVHQ